MVFKQRNGIALKKSLPSMGQLIRVLRILNIYFIKWQHESPGALYACARARREGLWKLQAPPWSTMLCNVWEMYIGRWIQGDETESLLSPRGCCGLSYARQGCRVASEVAYAGQERKEFQERDGGATFHRALF